MKHWTHGTSSIRRYGFEVKRTRPVDMRLVALMATLLCCFLIAGLIVVKLFTMPTSQSQTKVLMLPESEANWIKTEVF